MIIVLIGYMGSGKSSVGKILAKKLNYDFIDLDDFIEENEHATVSEIFDAKGEVYFRKKEMEYLRGLLQRDDNFILSLGGGTPCYSNNMQLIVNTKNTKSIYLKGSVQKLGKKLFLKKAKRPLIAHIKTEELMLEFVGKHLFERATYYNKAEIQIVTDNKGKQEVVEAIILELF